MTLVIVESPTKARTFNRILREKDYFVFATLGHIRDLPKNKMAVDYEKNFKPTYEVIKSKNHVVEKLKKLAKENSQIILATDLDREGESIAYHVAYLLGFIKEKWPKIEIEDGGDKLKRIIFHEITPSALQEALKAPQTLRVDLIKAQQARRILDRIVGYELSPLLWQKMGKHWLSAGRVQTVALRFIVEREKEIQNFKLEKYFQIFGIFKNSEEIRAKLVRREKMAFEKTIKIKVFAGDYQYIKTQIQEKNLQDILHDLESDKYQIKDVQESIVSRYPPPPFTTSLLQQDAFNKFGFTTKMTMRLAQDLYERGLITYHRTDSFNLAANFLFKTREFIAKKFGKNYALDKPRRFKTKSRSAQEAHEAIRPTKLGIETLEIKKESDLNKNHKLLCELIFRRSVASQMKEAQIKQIKGLIEGAKKYIFEGNFQQVLFDGFLRVLNPKFVQENQRGVKIVEGSKLILEKLNSEERYTQPPPRYTEASLVKALEEREIGRPSTYAPIINLIQEKYYTEKEGRYFKPTNLGEAVSDYLKTAFPDIFNLNFTASMEDGLDKIAQGKKDLINLLSEFNNSFQRTLLEKKKDKAKIKVKEEIQEKCPRCGNPLVVRFSRFGKFYACSTYPKCKFTKSALKYVKGKTCPRCSGKIVVRYTKKKKRFYGCENYPKCTFTEFSFKKL